MHFGTFPLPSQGRRTRKEKEGSKRRPSSLIGHHCPASLCGCKCSRYCMSELVRSLFRFWFSFSSCWLDPNRSMRDTSVCFPSKETLRRGLMSMLHPLTCRRGLWQGCDRMKERVKPSQLEQASLQVVVELGSAVALCVGLGVAGSERRKAATRLALSRPD